MEQQPCSMCMSAWNTEGLTSENDLSYHTLTETNNGYRMILRSGARKPVTILMEKYRDGEGWGKIGYYRPLYCPNCGRKIDKSAPKET